MTWATDKPTAPGWYWCYFETDDPDYPGFTSAVEVVAGTESGLGLRGWVPRGDYAERLANPPWDGALWQGPIEAPAAPEAKP